MRRSQVLETLLRPRGKLGLRGFKVNALMNGMAQTMIHGIHAALQHNIEIERRNSHFDSLESAGPM